MPVRGTLQANPGYNPLLACYDLTRIGTLPASNDCPSSTSGRYTYRGHADVRELSPYVEDLIKIKNLTFRLGLRGDYYYGITRAGPCRSPGWALSTGSKPTNTVLSFSYARTLETPFNENLILSSLGCNDAVASVF